MTVPYSTTDDVNTLLGPHKVTSDTSFTLANLTAVLLRLSARVDAILNSVGFAPVPVVDDSSTEIGILLGHLKTVVSWGGAAISFKANFPEAVGPGETPAYAYWDKKWTDALIRLAARQDVPRSLFGTIYQAASYFSENPDQELIVGQDIGLLAGSSLFVVDDLGSAPW